MRPLLASLALLLLALCRQSAGLSWDVKSMTSQSSTSSTSVSLVPKGKQSKFTQSVSHPHVRGKPKSVEGIVAKLFDMVPNAIILAALSAAEVSPEVPFLTKSLYNGVKCDFKTATNEKFNELIYNNPAGDRANDEKEAREDKSDGDGYECSSAPQKTVPEKAFFKCFCTEQKSLVYCGFFALKEHYAEVIKEEGKLNEVGDKPCRDVTVPALVASGPLGKLYDLDAFSKNSFEDAFNGKVDAYSTDEIKGILCDALKPNVEAAVKAVFASDGLYWMAEAVIYAVFFGEADESLTEACAESDFKSSEYGKCVCNQDTGISFCIYKVIAQAFKDAGYLKCDGGAPTFDASKKPASLPQLAKPKGKKSSASTTFSLLAPAAAAAALLLRQ